MAIPSSFRLLNKDTLRLWLLNIFLGDIMGFTQEEKKLMDEIKILCEIYELYENLLGLETEASPRYMELLDLQEYVYQTAKDREKELDTLLFSCKMSVVQ